MSSRKVRMELHRLLNSVQVQIVSTSNHLQILTEQYEVLQALNLKMHEEVISKVGKLTTKQDLPSQ